jgi:hypothetical protein
MPGVSVVKDRDVISLLISALGGVRLGAQSKVIYDSGTSVRGSSEGDCREALGHFHQMRRTR